MMTKEKELIVTSQRFRTQERNEEDAWEKLVDYVKTAMIEPKERETGDWEEEE